ncbi:MAG: hypothetical protein U5L04_04520 [Trueperaceae bacterium]|nr:hypothetical protein [Trueperaceae bacterium]
MKKAHVIKAIVFRCGAFGALVTLALLGLFGSIANAEGSRSLYPADYTTNFPNGDRAWFEWTDDTYYNDLVKRRTLLYVYAEAGEVLFLGSSSQGIESDDVTNTASGDIYVYENKAPVPGKEGNEDDPDAADADFRCSSKAEADSPTPGYIENRVQELAGPKRNPSNPDSSDAGYIPCTHADADRRYR